MNTTLLAALTAILAFLAGCPTAQAKLVLSLRFADGSALRQLTAADVGTITTIQVWAVVDNEIALGAVNGTGTHEGLQNVFYNLVSSRTSPASIFGELENPRFVAPFGSQGSRSGNHEDLNGDGILDFGDNDSVNNGFNTQNVFARSSAQTFDTPDLWDEFGVTHPTTNVLPNGIEFLIETVEFRITGLGNGQETRFIIAPPNWEIGALRHALWWQDSSLERLRNGGVQDGVNNNEFAGSSLAFVISAVPEPETAALAAAGVLGLAIRLSRGRRKVWLVSGAALLVVCSATTAQAKLAINLRFADGSTTRHLTAADIGTTIQLQAWASVDNELAPADNVNGTGTHEGLQSVAYSIASNRSSPGSIFGDLKSSQLVAPFSGLGAQPGANVDLNGDGIKDYGSVAAESDGNVIRPRSPSNVFDEPALWDDFGLTHPTVVLQNNGIDFLVQRLLFRVDGMGNGYALSFQPQIPSWIDGAVPGSNWWQDSSVERQPQGNVSDGLNNETYFAGTSITFTGDPVPEPGSAALSLTAILAVTVAQGIRCRLRRRYGPMQYSASNERR